MSEESDESGPMIGSMIRFVSDWVGGGDYAQQPPPFRTRRSGGDGGGTYEVAPDDDGVGSGMVIEMKNLGDTTSSNTGTRGESGEKMALEEWKRIGNIDTFLEQMYAYYTGGGFYGILFRRLVNLFIVGFLVSFSLFLAYAVQWDFIHQSATAATHPTLSSVINVSGLLQMPWIVWGCVITFYGLWAWHMSKTLQDIPNLSRISRFYQHLLSLYDHQLATTEFSDIVEKLATIQKSHPITVTKLDAADVSNRIMRRENYLIALFNRDVFNLEVSLPSGKERRVMALTKTLEWNLSFCILNYLFDESGSVRKDFLRNIKTERLVEGLKRRLLVMGVLNLLMAPLVLVFLVIYFIFRYGEEFYRNPRSLGMRQYTTAARWKLREFNELSHYFQRRLTSSFRKANKYMEQFRNERFNSLIRLISFITGSFAILLIMLTVVNEDLLMHFEISPGKSVIWYLGLFGAMLAICRSMMFDPSRANDPTKLMTEIVEYTHYLPKHWRGKFHTEQVHQEFSNLFDYKLSILLNELVSVIVTPFLLIFSIPSSAEAILDFFREFTVHVDGSGYVCSFALFDFKRHGNPKFGGDAIDKNAKTRQGKMEKSFLTLVSNNPNWEPDEAGSQFLGKILDFEGEQSKNMGSALGMGRNSMAVFRKPQQVSRRPSPLMYTADLQEGQDGDQEGENGNRGIISILNNYYEHRISH